MQLALPNSLNATDLVNSYIDWGAGPRASQNLILAAKANAAFNGKFSPDIEDVKAVATGILRHRIIKNYKADADGITEEMIIVNMSTGKVQMHTVNMTNNSKTIMNDKESPSTGKTTITTTVE